MKSKAKSKTGSKGKGAKKVADLDFVPIQAQDEYDDNSDVGFQDAPNKQGPFNAGRRAYSAQPPPQPARER